MVKYKFARLIMGGIMVYGLYKGTMYGGYYGLFLIVFSLFIPSLFLRWFEK